MIDRDVAIIGAGPYGLAAAAYLNKINGLGVSVFGEPMSFWRTAMPKGMLLRSSWSASHIADPNAELTLDTYKTVSGNHLCTPIGLQRFVEYGLWYQRSGSESRSPAGAPYRISEFSIPPHSQRRHGLYLPECHRRLRPVRFCSASVGIRWSAAVFGRSFIAAAGFHSLR